MNPTVYDMVQRSLDYLSEVNSRRACPHQARVALRDLQQQVPDTTLDLLWEEQAYDGSFHYDLLLRLSDRTISIGICPDKALPWPMRGVQRWTDKHLLRVNATLMKVDQGIACLDQYLEDTAVMVRLINACIIEEELNSNPVSISNDELQTALDAFRRKRKLYHADHTQQWLKDRGITHQQLERWVADEVAVAKLRERICGDRIEAYFEQHRAGFESVGLARIDFPKGGDAVAVSQDVIHGRRSFFEVACQSYLYGAETSTITNRELFVTLRRAEMPIQLADACFRATPREVVGPIEWNGVYSVYQVLWLREARLDERTRATIERQLFEEWLSSRRASSKIEWYWGNQNTLSQ